MKWDDDRTLLCKLFDKFHWFCICVCVYVPIKVKMRKKFIIDLFIKIFLHFSSSVYVYICVYMYLNDLTTTTLPSYCYLLLLHFTHIIIIIEKKALHLRPYKNFFSCTLASQALLLHVFKRFIYVYVREVIILCCLRLIDGKRGKKDGNKNTKVTFACEYVW